MYDTSTEFPEATGAAVTFQLPRAQMLTDLLIQAGYDLGKVSDEDLEEIGCTRADAHAAERERVQRLAGLRRQRNQIQFKQTNGTYRTVVVGPTPRMREGHKPAEHWHRTHGHAPRLSSRRTRRASTRTVARGSRRSADDEGEPGPAEPGLTPLQAYSQTYADLERAALERLDDRTLDAFLDFVVRRVARVVAGRLEWSQ